MAPAGRHPPALPAHLACATACLTRDPPPPGTHTPPHRRASEDRKLLLKLLIKAADVSNPAKALPLYLYWTERILEEFYDQGDEEKRLGLPVTAMPQCDRTKPGVPAGQKGFTAFVVRPTFAALAAYSDELLDARWRDQLLAAVGGQGGEGSGSGGDGGGGGGSAPARPWAGLGYCTDQLDANLAFWKQVEATVPAETIAVSCLPSDFPLAEVRSGG